MRILTDLDNVLVPDTAFEIASKELGYSFTSCDHIHWDPYRFMPKNLADLLVEKWHDPAIMNTLPEIPGSKKVLDRWKGQGHEIFVVTARHTSLAEGTAKMVDRLFPGCISETIVVGPSTDKIDVIKDLKADTWIDDAPHQVVSCLRHNVHSILITNTHTRYNWHVWNTPGLRCRNSLSYITGMDLLPMERY